MFDIADRPLVFIPVKWTVLRPGEGDDALAVETEAVIEVEVELKDRDAILELFNEYFDEGDGPKVDGEKLTGRDLEAKRFLSVVKRWRKVASGKTPLELNDENVRKLLALPGFAAAFEAAYLAACAGKAEIRKGN